MGRSRSAVSQLDVDGVDEEDEEEYEVVGSDGDSDSDDEDFKAGVQHTEIRGTTRQGRRRAIKEKEAAKLAKVMSKRAAPTQFSGEKESEKEGVEQWVVDANDYLDSQFGQLAHSYPRERMQLIRSYIKGAAATWITAALQSDPSQTWETLQRPFVEFIRGRPRESLTMAREDEDSGLWKRQVQGPAGVGAGVRAAQGQAVPYLQHGPFNE